MDSFIEDAIDEAEQREEEAPGGTGDASAGADADTGTTDAGEGGAPPSGSMTDEELASVVDDLDTEITVFGCGGAGGNTVTRMY